MSQEMKKVDKEKLEKKPLLTREKENVVFTACQIPKSPISQRVTPSVRVD
jgi:hypothetical protein